MYTFQGFFSFNGNNKKKWAGWSCGLVEFSFSYQVIAKLVEFLSLNLNFLSCAKNLPKKLLNLLISIPVRYIATVGSVEWGKIKKNHFLNPFLFSQCQILAGEYSEVFHDAFTWNNVYSERHEYHRWGFYSTPFQKLQSSREKHLKCI